MSHKKQLQRADNLETVVIISNDHWAVEDDSVLTSRRMGQIF